MYPIFDFLPLVEMLRKNILPLIPLFVLQFHIITIFNFQNSFYTTSVVSNDGIDRENTVRIY